MAERIVHAGATVRCSHGGGAFPTSAYPRVLVAGQPVVTVGTSYAVGGCALAGTGTPPCESGDYWSGATRVVAGGVPVVIATGASMCRPTGTPLIAVDVQARVLAV